MNNKKKLKTLVIVLVVAGALLGITEKAFDRYHFRRVICQSYEQKLTALMNLYDFNCGYGSLERDARSGDGSLNEFCLRAVIDARIISDDFYSHGCSDLLYGGLD